MSRWLLACTAIALIAGQVFAQGPALGPARLNVVAQGPPSRSLRYRLVPSISEQKAEDGGPLFKQAAEAMQRLYDREQQTKADSFLNIKKCPTPDHLPKEAVHRFLEQFDDVLKTVDRAARCERCDWGLTQRLREQGFAAALPEVQQMRSIGNLLALRARLAMAEGRLEDALRDLETGFTAARRVAEGPTVISALVGIALTHVMCRPLEELIERDRAPNLYWTLTDLPRPFIGMRSGLEGERLAIYASFPGLADAGTDLKTPPLSREKARDLLKLTGIIFQDREELLIERALPGDVVKGIRHYDTGLAILARHEEAKAALVALGRPRELVDAMPHLQVAILHALSDYDRLLDEISRLEGLPFWEAYPRVRESLKRSRLEAEMNKPDAPALPLAAAVLPAMEKVLAAQARLERRLAALRCVEAVRLYAAAHEGKVPAALADIKDVPEPIDPATGRAFEYSVKDAMATLYAPPWDKKETPDARNSIRIELQVRR